MMSENQKKIAALLLKRFQGTGYEMKFHEMMACLTDLIYKNWEAMPMNAEDAKEKGTTIRKQLSNLKYIYCKDKDRNVWALTEKKGIRFKSWEDEEEREKMNDENFILTNKKLRADNEILKNKIEELKTKNVWKNRIIAFIIAIITALAIAFLT